VKYAQSNKKGFTIMEMIVYITISTVVVSTAVVGIVRLNSELGRYEATRILNNAGQTALERMVREVRAADNINRSGYIFGINPGVLKLNSTDVVTGDNKLVSFTIVSGIIELSDNGQTSPLTPDDVMVTELFFNDIVTSESEAVKISMVLETTKSGTTYEQALNTTTVLRGSY
jgi:type II secretory pathway pseudopilin PulG